MSNDVEKLILDRLSEIESKVDTFVHTVNLRDSEQAERIKAAETRAASLQYELTQHKEENKDDIKRVYDKMESWVDKISQTLSERKNSIFQIIGAISGVVSILTVVAAIIAGATLLMQKGMI